MADSRRRGLSCSTVALLILAITALAGALAAFGYFRFLRYDRVAALHLPPDTVAAARLDVEQGVLYGPVRQHWIPLLGEALGDDSADSARLARFEERSGLRRIDLREVVFAKGQGATDWLFVVAGLFPKDGDFSGRLLSALQAEGVTSFRPGANPRSLVQEGTGLSVGQAVDGAVIVASAEALLSRALPAQETHAALGLPLKPAGGLAIRGELLRDFADSPMARVTPGLKELQRIARITGSLVLGDRLTVDLTIHPVATPDSAPLRGAVDRLLDGLRLLSRLDPRPDIAGERSALERATVGDGDGGQVTLSFYWERHEVERGAKAAADVLRSILLAGPHSRK